MNPDPFVESQVVEGNVLLLRPRGSLDTVSTEDFNRIVQAHLEEGRCNLVVDCAELDYVSSLGVGALIVLQARLRKRQGELKLASIQGPVARLLQAVRIDKVLAVYEDAEQAAEAFRKLPS